MAAKKKNAVVDPGAASRWLDLAKGLMEQPAVACKEECPQAFIKQFAAKRKALKLSSDKAGNLILKYGNPRAETPLVMVAHLDHPGFWIGKRDGGSIDLVFKGGVASKHVRAETQIQFPASVKVGLPGTLKAERGVKALILMTDGENTRAPDYPTHNSTIAALANQLTKEICVNIKNDEIVVYTIAFEVTDPEIKDILEGCATSPSYFFDAASALSETAVNDSPGGSIRPFCEPPTVTSTPHSSCR